MRRSDRLLVLVIRPLVYLRPQILRWRTARLCWWIADKLLPVMEAALLNPRRSLPRIILARTLIPVVEWIMLTGARLAPEGVRGVRG